MWGLAALALLPTAAIPYHRGDPTDGATLFQDVRARVSRGAIDSLSDSDLWIRAARGLVGQLDDPYAELYSPEELANFSRNNLRNDYGGVGMSLQDQLGTVVITGTFPGSPAARAGVQAGDRIVAVNDTTTGGLRLDQVSDRIVGPAGTEVSVTFVRPGVRDPIRMRFTRARIHVPSVPYALVFDQRIGYLPLQRFSSASGEDVGEAIAALRREGARGFVLDLRGNPGGSLNQAVAVAERFLAPSQEVVSVRYRDQDPEVFRAGQPAAEGDGVLRTTEPVVVLLDGGAASASEIVAGALQDHDRALVVGTTSFGKGLVQSLYPLRQGWALKLTTGRWYTPSGRSIQRDRVLRNGRLVLVTPDSLETDSVRHSRPAYHSDAGRVVYGGGGITPDVIVSSDTISTAAQHFLRAIAPSSQRVYRALYDFALARRPGLRPDFTVTDSWRDSLYNRMVRDSVELPRSQYDSAAVFVDRLIAQQVATVAFGDSAAFRRAAPRDAQLQRALEFLRAAGTQKQLIALGGGS